MLSCNTTGPLSEGNRQDAEPQALVAGVGAVGCAVSSPLGRYQGSGGDVGRRWRRRPGRGAGYVWGQCTRWCASCSTCIGRLLVIMQRQILQSCTDSVIDVGVVLQLQFIDRVFLPRCEQRQVPCFSAWVSGVAVH